MVKNAENIYLFRNKIINKIKKASGEKKSEKNLYPDCMF